MCLAKPCWLFPNPRSGRSWPMEVSGNEEQAARDGHGGVKSAESRQEPAPFQPEQSQNPAKILLQHPKSGIVNRNPGRIPPEERRSEPDGPGNAGNSSQHHPALGRQCQIPKNPQELSWDTTQLSGFLLCLCSSIQQLQHFFSSGVGSGLCFPLFLNLFIFILDF